MKNRVIITGFQMRNCGHFAHTRPVFRAEDWEYYKIVNNKFADVLLEEIKDIDELLHIRINEPHFD